VAEVLKLLSGYSQTVENEYTLVAEQGNIVSTNYISRIADCLACAHKPLKSIPPLAPTATLSDLMETLAQELQLTGPGTYVSIPGAVPWTRPSDIDANLPKTLKELGVVQHTILSVTHPIFGTDGKHISVSFRA